MLWPSSLIRCYVIIDGDFNCFAWIDPANTAAADGVVCPGRTPAAANCK